MNETRARLYAAGKFRQLVGKSVSQVGHSIGSVINVGIGPTHPQRSNSRRSLRRPQSRWDRKAKTDLLLWTVAWRLHAGGSVRLDGEKTLDRRIKREIGGLVGKRVIDVRWRDPLLQFTLVFGRGLFLKVDLRKSHMSGSNEWTMFIGHSLVSKTENEGRFLISAK